MGKPIKHTDLGKSDVISSNQIVWQGPSIPCIDLCEGDTVSTVVYKVAEKICEISKDLDLTSLDLQCIIGLCQACPKDATFWSLKNILQLLLDNDCKLKSLIEGLEELQNTSNSETAIVLDLKCLKDDYLALCGVLPDTLDLVKVLQIFVNNICTFETNIDSLSTLMTQLEFQLSQLGDCTANTYDEPFINSCLNVAGPDADNNGTPDNALQLSNHIRTITDPAVCALRAIVGTEDDLSSTIATQCIDDYIGISPVTQNATNITQVISNDNIIICDLLSRIKSIESTCCAPTCSDIRIGFLSTYNSLTNEYTLSFSFGAGTFIPAGFIDTGSTITFTDFIGNTFTIPTNGLLTNSSNFTVSMAGLDTSGIITVKINTSFSINIPGNSYTKPSILKCEDCFGGSMDAATKLTQPSCWQFTVPKDLTAGETWSYHSIRVCTTGVYTSIPITQNIINNANMLGSLPATIAQCSLDASQPESNTIILKIDNQNNTIPPLLGAVYQEGVTTYPVMYAVGTLINPCPTC